MRKLYILILYSHANVGPEAATREVSGSFTTDFNWQEDQAAHLCVVIKLLYKAQRPEFKSYQMLSFFFFSSEILLDEDLSSLLFSTS